MKKIEVLAYGDKILVERLPDEKDKLGEVKYKRGKVVSVGTYNQGMVEVIEAGDVLVFSRDSTPVLKYKLNGVDMELYRKPSVYLIERSK